MAREDIEAFLAEPASVHRLVMLRASRIGDFVCATPAFRAIREHFPGAELTLVALPIAAPLAARLAHIDRFLPFPGWPGIAEQFFEADHALAFFRQMQAQRFDLALQLHGSGVYANPFTLMLGARATAGFIRPGDPPNGLDLAIPFPGAGRECERLLALPRALGAEAEDDRLEFPWLDADGAAAAQLLAGRPRPLVGLHLDAREEGKNLPSSVLPSLRALGAGRGTLVLLGSEPAWPVDTYPATLDLRGRTDLPVLGAAIASLDLLISSDSGPAHIAYALGTPSVTVFRTTDPARWGPPSSSRHLVIPPCPLTSLPGAVVAATRRLLATEDAERGTRPLLRTQYSQLR